MLGVSPSVIESYGAVSAECAAAMASGARSLMSTTHALATTGVAGPGLPGRPPGRARVGGVCRPRRRGDATAGARGGSRCRPVGELSRRAVGARWHAPQGRFGPRVALAPRVPTHPLRRTSAWCSFVGFSATCSAASGCNAA
ncbi:CinA family protein [Nocardioides sp. B-3]|uniref:CinA family protein n=1 Tax=Nocardioides sp. B-3 TaxID=2895565 RepID=UPI003FA5F6CD